MGLECTTYRIEFLPEDQKALPRFLGGVIRGAFGRSLRALACATGAPACDGCPVAARCAYREVFDPVPPAEHPLQRFGAIPAPYAFDLEADPPRDSAPGRPLSIRLTLAGAARRHLGLILLALERAAAGGLAKPRARFGLATVHVETADGHERLLMERAGARIPPHPPTARLDAVGAVPADARDLRLAVRLLAPCRLVVRGRAVRPEGFTPYPWLMALVRRVSLMADFHGDGPLGLDFGDLADRAAATRLVEADLRFVRVERWSSRQRQTMPFDGLAGAFAIEGPLAPFLPLAALATRLNVGKHASFGLGVFRLAQNPTSG
jgi:hypothetical protein